MTSAKDLPKAHADQNAALKAKVSQVEASVDAMVREIASSVRAEAARKQHRIGIRIGHRRDGVRITITGRDANRYRGPVQAALEKRAPALKAEIRTMLTKR